MKKIIRPAYFLTLFIFLILSCTMIAFSTKQTAAVNTTGAVLIQASSTPPVEEGPSEVGSTDEIVLMGGVIAAIILIPILLQQRVWRNESQS
jgi:hypothetical protein